MQLYTVGIVTLLVLLLTSCSTNPNIVDTSTMQSCDDLTVQEERLYLANEASNANIDTQNIGINNNNLWKSYENQQSITNTSSIDDPQHRTS